MNSSRCQSLFIRGKKFENVHVKRIVVSADNLHLQTSAFNVTNDRLDYCINLGNQN